MDRIVCYIPSYNDSPLVAQSLASVPDWDVVISDNASDEPHRAALAALAGPRVQVVRHEKSLGRVGNWKSCVEHFVASGAAWMKFLGAGDRHKPNALDIFRRAIRANPEARFFVGQIEHVWPDGPAVWKVDDVPIVITPEVAMEALVVKGNIFNSMLAPLIHVDVLGDGFAWGEEVLSFCADLLFLMGIAKKTRTYYIPEIVAEMVMTHRKTFSAKAGTLENYLEEGLVRLRAADYLFELTGDRPKRDALVAHVATLMKQWLDKPIETLARGRAARAPDLG